MLLVVLMNNSRPLRNVNTVRLICMKTILRSIITGIPLFTGVLLCTTLCCNLFAVKDDAPTEIDPRFEKMVQPFFRQHCERCHSQKKAEGEFRVDLLTPGFGDLVNRGHWSEVVNVLNGHEMPPEDEPQPSVDSAAAVIDWVTENLAREERARRNSAIVLRRMNRDEYRNTIRDLAGVDVDVSGFPQDPSAGGFDNNGQTLSVSPLLLELYYRATGKILDKALVTEPQPPTLKWRFEPESGDSDSNRVVYDGQRLIVNGGKSRVEGDFKVMHHESWDRHLNIRDFALPHAGRYILRIRATGKVPTREEVVESAETYLRKRLDDQMKENPKGEKWHRQGYEETLKHFRTDPMYDYGPPRLKVTQTLAGQPRVITEFDVDASGNEFRNYEIPVDFTTDRAGFEVIYAYAIPRELENFWFQTGDNFARPEAWVDWIELEGPINLQWPPESHRRIMLSENFDTAPGDAMRRRPEAERIVETFLKRAFRRPVSKDELADKMRLYDAAAAMDGSLIEAIRPALAAVLVSPNFLYLAEPSTDSGIADATGAVSEAPNHRHRLDQYQIASRLSYFLWSSMPDDRLFSLASENKLTNPAVLESEVDRMLADPKADAFVENFAGQWLGLREVGANPPAEDLYPRYDRHLEQSIVGESQAFFAEILREDLSVMNFVASDFVVINERLGRYYGIPGVRGDHFRRVDVPKSVHRGGVVTQASVLSITSNGTRTSPVKRGTWVMKNILGIDPGLPVANAGDISPKVPGIDKATVRQRLEIHRTLPQCARCHNKIDPLGFALENFNAAGAWRDREGFGYKGRIDRNDPLIDASAKMIDGTEFVGVDGLQKVLLKQEDLFLKCLSGKLMTYALGRELGVADAPFVNQAVDHMNSNGDSLRSLIRWIVKSEVFQTK